MSQDYAAAAATTVTRRKTTKRQQRRVITTMTLFLVLFLGSFLLVLLSRGVADAASDNHQDIIEENSSSSSNSKNNNNILKIPVYTSLVLADAAAAADATFHTSSSMMMMIARKQIHDLPQTLPTDQIVFDVVSLTTLEQQQQFIEQTCGAAAAKRFDEFVGTPTTTTPLQPEFAAEVFKWCALQSNHHQQQQAPAATVFWESTSPAVMRLQDILDVTLSESSNNNNNSSIGNSMVVLAEKKYFGKSLQGIFVVLRKEHQHVAKAMLKTIVETPIASLHASPLLIPQTFYALVAKELSVDDDDDAQLQPGTWQNGWTILEQTCRMDPLRRMTLNKNKNSNNSRRQDKQSSSSSNNSDLIHQCPASSGFCCNIQNTNKSSVVMMTRYPIWPVQRIHWNSLPRPVGEKREQQQQQQQQEDASSVTFEEDELPFIATLREEIQPPRRNIGSTPNFYDMLRREDCLPSDEDCSKCLREKNGANCTTTCKDVCSCYCEKLCHVRPEAKYVSKKIIVTPPKYTRDSSRIIPRIVHQTWFESLDSNVNKYPNMSRLVESFKKSGWEYKFYTDESAANFLSTHFPPEVREAYDALIPGAFKADLFRYCVLLIHGGVYADVDIHLESTLDFSIPPDVGFMVPMDEPGKPVDRQMCLWNGFIAAAPGHPILAKAVETVVNHVRNRFTSVDTDATFCPDPELSVLHAYDTLFTAGPCLLGATVNRVYGRHGQQSHVPGEINPWQDEKATELAVSGTSFVLGNKGGLSFVDGTSKSLHHRRIPGRTIILRQNKWDMGAHRFTLLEQNLVISATDLPDSNDRENIESSKSGTTTEHYSKAHAKVGVYGVEHLYVDDEKANENIRFFVDNEHQSQKLEPQVSE